MSRKDEPYILVLGGSSDHQLMAVLEALQRASVPAVFIDHENPSAFAVEVGRHGAVRFTIDGEDRECPTVVWTRLKLNELLGDWGDGAVEEYVRRAEWRGLLLSVANLLRDRAIYPAAAPWEARSQLLQFVAAAKAGFLVPASFMFVGAKAAQNICQRFPAIVAKPIAARNVPRNGGNFDSYRVLLTMAVDSDAVAAEGPLGFETPAFFQERVRSGTEYRVIAFRDKAFSYAIKDKVETRIRPDERVLYGGELNGKRIYGAQYKCAETSDFIKSACASVLRDLDLEYGAFDIIVTDEGDHYFLECNPEGQWYAATGYNYEEVASAFADVLIARLSQSANSGKAQEVTQ